MTGRRKYQVTLNLIKSYKPACCSAEKQERDCISQVMSSYKEFLVHYAIVVHAVLSFCELGPKLLRMDGVQYLLSEVFSQDPLEAYFSRQRHKGGACDNPTVQQFHYNTVSLV